MKQELKTKQSYDRIMVGAICEFGVKSYEQASINTICQDYHISKGLFYHNFKSKDELYLKCIQECFQEMIKYLTHLRYDENDIKNYMKGYLNGRYHFFKEHPHFENIFFYALLQPPKHLETQIIELRKEFDKYNLAFYQRALDKMVLREGIQKDEALEYFIVMQEMFNGYFQCHMYENRDPHLLVQDHESKLLKLLDIMLYGIAKEDENVRT